MRKGYGLPARFAWALVLFVGMLSPGLRAQPAGMPADSSDILADSLRTYGLGEIVVGGETETASVGTVQTVSPAAWRGLDAPSVAEAARLIPATFIRTNSRGETLFSLRGTDERQTAVYLDGVPLTIPWDQRVDLSLVPAGVVGGARVVKGVPSVLYGPSIPGGVLDLATRERTREGVGIEATASGGAEAYASGATQALWRRGRFSGVAAVQASGADGFALASTDPVPFSQPDEDVRLNTDYGLAATYGRVGWSNGAGMRFGLSVLGVDADKGIAPESHVDPDSANVRYWRYPEWRYGQAALHGAVERSALVVRGAVWVTRFRQTIEQFQSADYAGLDARQHDDDGALGARLLVERPFGPVSRRGAIRLGLHVQRATHDTRTAEGDAAFDPDRRFSHTLGSLGLEGEVRPTDRLTLTAGASADRYAPDETGEQPGVDAILAPGLAAGGVFQVQPGLAVRASVGRKTRFPTMREWFDGALGRFVVNPDLKPESSWLGEVGVERQAGAFSAEAAVFGRLVDDSIDQIVLEDGQRQRVNLGGSRVFGVELAGAARLPLAFRLDAHLTLLDATAFNDEDDDIRPAETPGVIGYLGVSRRPARGLSAMAEAVHTGAAVSRIEGGDLRLDPSTQVNLRAGYRVQVPARSLDVEVFGRVNNVFDAVVLPQAGLPAPGREWRVGLALALD